MKSQFAVARFIMVSLVWLLIHSSLAFARPNVVVIVGDDMGYADVGVHGCRDIPTPHLDALARSGVRFTCGYVSGPYCSPTRAGLLTGRYQNRFGHEFNPRGPKQGMPSSETTLADRLRALGYATGLVGKWHLGSAPELRPQRRGFDEFFGFLPGAHDYFQAEGILRGDQPAEPGGYLTDSFGDEAVAFIERHQERPFFLYLAFNAVHTPLQADAARLDRFAALPEKRRKYAAMMSAMDDAIGRVTATLRDKGLAENTLIVFLSDNGGPVMNGTTVNGANNGPLRGSKRTTLEGGVRVPFFIAWPGTLPRGATFDHPIIQLDIAPTVLAAAGIETGLEQKLDGVNLLPFLQAKANAAEPHEALYWRFGDQMAVRKGRWKLVRYDQAAEGGKGTSPARLYDLDADLGESRDQAGAEPAIVAELQTLWDQWNASNVAPRWN